MHGRSLPQAGGLQRRLRGIGQLNGIATQCLGAVHRHIGLFGQLNFIVAVLGIERDADAGRDTENLAGQFERLAQGQTQFFANQAGILGVLDAAQ